MRKNKRNSAFFPRENEKNVFSDSRQVSTRSTSILRKLPPRSLLSLFHNRLRSFKSSNIISLQGSVFTQLHFYAEFIRYSKQTKRIRERTIVSSIKPQFDNQIFVDLWFLYKLRT